MKLEIKEVERKVLFRHNSGWVIVLEPRGFPSQNYCVFKASTSSWMQKVPSYGIAYCNSLESALNQVFRQIIIENVEKAEDYRGSVQDLMTAITDARKDFEELFILKKEVKKKVIK